jgi:hypothetical protein
MRNNENKRQGVYKQDVVVTIITEKSLTGFFCGIYQNKRKGSIRVSKEEKRAKTIQYIIHLT